MRYVIIGGSAAAIGCIEGVRSVDKTGEIILITGETEWNYSRPLISYLLEGKTTRDKMWCRPDSFFTRNGVTVKAGVLATTLDAGDRTVRLSTGERLAYDRLLGVGLLVVCAAHFWAGNGGAYLLLPDAVRRLGSG